MRLFHVQDGDRPLYVVAETFEEAHGKWESVIRAENEMDASEDCEMPDGISCVCDKTDLVLPGHRGALI